MEQAILAVDWVNSLPTSVLIGVAVILVTLYYWPIWQRYRYPPGPLPWPFVGNLPLFLTTFANLGEYYYGNRDQLGDVFTLHLGGPQVWLNSTEAIYEGFVKNADALSNRPTSPELNPMNELGFTGSEGIVDSPDGVWQEFRRHLLAVFREQGLGKVEMEDLIKTEIKYFHEVLDELKQKPINLQDQIKQSVSNIATHIAFGTRLEYGEERLAILQLEDFFSSHFTTANAPILRYLPFDPMGFQTAKKKMLKTVDFILRQIDEHKKTIDFDSPRDYIDSFLIQRAKHKGTNETIFTDQQLVAMLMQIYVAGTDTTSSVLYWTFLYLVVRPDVQEKIYQEVKKHIGERSPAYADRGNMPYTMATITELLRIDIAQQTLPHIATRDVVVQGHIIPKGTRVIANLYANTHDELLYQSPEKFEPGRFLDDEGNYIKPDSKSFVPFSIGRRSCPGERLARMEIFLFLVCTLQKYQVLLGQDEMPSTEGKVTLTFLPKDAYKVKFVLRT